MGNSGAINPRRLLHRKLYGLVSFSLGEAKRRLLVEAGARQAPRGQTDARSKYARDSRRGPQLRIALSQKEGPSPRRDPSLHGGIRAQPDSG